MLCFATTLCFVAGWCWWPICGISAVAAWIWMSILPEHGNHGGGRLDTIWNIVYYYWFEGVALAVSAIAIVLLIVTREIPIFEGTIGTIGHALVLVSVAAVLQHGALVTLYPRSLQSSYVMDQARIFQDKHTYIMTVLYTMSFGSFIGFSGAFPKLITDLC